MWYNNQYIIHGRSKLTGKLIIVDGMDRCGKSTLVKSIYQKVAERNPNTVVFHCDKPPMSLSKDEQLVWSKVHYIEMINLCFNMKSAGWNVILDRSWLGEYVYGALYRKYDVDWVLKLSHDSTNIFDFSDVSYTILIDNGHNLLLRSDNDSLYDSEIESKKLQLIDTEYNLFKDFYNKSLELNFKSDIECLDWKSYNSQDFKSIIDLRVNQILGV